jgi:hypothetical protein
VQCIILGTDGKRSIREKGKDRRTGLEVETRQVKRLNQSSKYEKSTYTCGSLRRGHHTVDCRGSHFFNTILVLEALARLHLLLAVEEVVRSGLTLG